MKYKHEDSLLAFLKLRHMTHMNLYTIIKNIFPSFFMPCVFILFFFKIPGNKELIAILYTHNDYYDDDDERGLHTLDIHIKFVK